MGRYTRAYSNWIERKREIERLNGLAKKSINLRQLDNANSLYRACVVLLCSHIEGYVKGLAEVALERVYVKKLPKGALGLRSRYYLSRDLLDQLRDKKDPDKISESVVDLFYRDTDIWSSNGPYIVEPAADRFIYGFASPNFDQIKKFFLRFGYDRYKNDIAHLLQANYAVCVNMLKQVVEQRNLIVHDQNQQVGTPHDVDNMIIIVSLFIRSTDTLVGNWFRQIGCPIRTA